MTETSKCSNTSANLSIPFNFFYISLPQPFPWSFSLSALGCLAKCSKNICCFGISICPSPVVVGPKLVILCFSSNLFSTFFCPALCPGWPAPKEYILQAVLATIPIVFRQWTRERRGRWNILS